MKDRVRLAALKRHAETCPACALRLKIMGGQMPIQELVGVLGQHFGADPAEGSGYPDKPAVH